MAVTGRYMGAGGGLAALHKAVEKGAIRRGGGGNASAATAFPSRLSGSLAKGRKMPPGGIAAPGAGRPPGAPLMAGGGAAKGASDVLFHVLEGVLLQPGHLRLADADLVGNLHLRAALEEA